LPFAPVKPFETKPSAAISAVLGDVVDDVLTVDEQAKRLRNFAIRFGVEMGRIEVDLLTFQQR
jgi:hypothetical protein